MTIATQKPGYFLVPTESPVFDTIAFLTEKPVFDVPPHHVSSVNSTRISIRPMQSSWPLLTQTWPSSCQSFPLRWTVNHGPATKWTPSSHNRAQI